MLAKAKVATKTREREIGNPPRPFTCDDYVSLRHNRDLRYGDWQLPRRTPGSRTAAVAADICGREVGNMHTPGANCHYVWQLAVTKTCGRENSNSASVKNTRLSRYGQFGFGRLRAARALIDRSLPIVNVRSVELKALLL